MQAEGEPIDVAPRGIFRHDAGQQASKEQAEEEAGRSDGESGCPAVGGSEVADQWKHCSPSLSGWAITCEEKIVGGHTQLRRHRRDRGDQGQGAENGKGVGQTQPQPFREKFHN